MSASRTSVSTEHSFASIASFVTATVFVLLLAGCGSDGSSNTDAPSPTTSALPIPAAVQAKINSDASNVAAGISIDGGTEQAMSISGGVATVEINGLEPGAHTVVITFYQTAGTERIVLARHTSEVNVVAGETTSLGQNELTYVTDTFDFDEDSIPNIDDLDNDNDGLSDDDEPAYGLNPFDGDSDNDGTSDGNEVQLVSIVTAIPQSVRAKISNEVIEFVATVKADDSAEEEMQINVDRTTVSLGIPGLVPGDHTLTITFYQVAGAERIILARHTTDITVIAGQATAWGDGTLTYDTAFDDDDDDVINVVDTDNDNDGVLDIYEEAYGLSPFNPDSDDDDIDDAAEIGLRAVLTPIPAAVQARATALEVDIGATIRVDDGVERDMTLSAGAAGILINALLPGESATLVITFYLIADSARVVFARNTTEVTIAVNQATILGAGELSYITNSSDMDVDDDDTPNISDVDIDGDTILDSAEAGYLKNPLLADSDDDEIADADEVAIQVSGRGDHSCIVLLSGGVRCWGYNEDGELGNGGSGSNLISFVPVAASGIGDAIAVRTSQTHSCAQLENESVYCWGSNAFGEISSDVVDSDTPLEVSFMAGASDIQLTLGITCGIVTNGLLSCLGDSSNPITAYVNDDEVQAVGPGAYHSCMVIPGGTVSCYADPLILTSNSSGQLGDGTNLPPLLGPIAVLNITTASSVAVGANHSCALLQSGIVQCWGANDESQIGDGTSISRLEPVTVGSVEGATAIAVGADHTCALLQSGSVRCWGDNTSGQVGNGSDADSINNPALVTGITNAISISAGESHSCAVLANGRVQCWGRNAYGQLGNGDAPGELESSSTPVFVSGF